MKLLKPDFVPRMQDRGLDDIILDAFAHQVGISTLRMSINRQHGDLGIDTDELMHYIAERGGLGLTFTGELPAATPRPDAPTGLAQNSKSVSFASPACDLRARWYVNGRFAADGAESCARAAGRRIDKGDIGVVPGDVVQVALLDGGVVGWWARIEVE